LMPPGSGPPKLRAATVSRSGVSSKGSDPSVTAQMRPAWWKTLVLPDPPYQPPSSRGTGASPRRALASGVRTQRLRYQRAFPPWRSTPWTMPSPANQW
jgi:hypothetical protein